MIDIVIPVYADYAVTRRCVESVLATSTDQVEIVVIYDCGPDENILSYLRDLDQRRLITLVVNSENSGFVKSVNLGMALHTDRDVIILNSDTEVANDWVARLLVHAGRNPDVGTITPFSNNAEICSFPGFCQDNESEFLKDVTFVDSVISKYLPATLIDVPTGVGFCMYIRRVALNDVGYFDADKFGRGYGEENDFCRRIAVKGWRNTHCLNIYVYHAGGVSFSEEKIARVESAMVILDRDYPDYHRLVHDFIQQDPAKAYRAKAELELFRQSDHKKVLAISHNMGGGTVRHIAELQQYLSGSVIFAVLKPVTFNSFAVTLGGRGKQSSFNFRWPEDREHFLAFSRYLGISQVHVHHVKGIEAYAHEILECLGLPYIFTLHDYYLINGNPALVDEQGRYCVDLEQRDTVCARSNPVPLGMVAAQWREAMESILKGATQVIAPCEYTAKVYSQYFPTITIKKVYHPDFEMHPGYAPVESRPLDSEFRILVMGALSLEKGADVLERVARTAAKQGRPWSFHLVGYAYRELSSDVHVHGAYKDEELPELVKELGPHLVWFPCQWPETYSYTLSHCLEMGLPVAAPALGAFEERLQGRPLSWLQEYPVTDEQWLETLAVIEGDLRISNEEELLSWFCSRGENYYRDAYADSIDTSTQESGFNATIDELSFWLDRGNAVQQVIRRKERLLGLIYRVRSLPLIRSFSRLIPISWQRKLKRLLSSKPMHEVDQEQ